MSEVVQLTEIEINSMVLSCPKICSSRTGAQKRIIEKQRILYEHFYPIVRRTARSVVPSWMIEDIISGAYFVLQRCMASFGEEGAERVNFSAYFLRSVKRYALRYLKHNKTSYFTRNTDEIVVSLDSMEHECVESTFVYMNDTKNRKKLSFDCRFSGDDLRKVKFIIRLIEIGIPLKTIKKEVNDKFIVEWTVFKLKELFYDGKLSRNN